MDELSTTKHTTTTETASTSGLEDASTGTIPDLSMTPNFDCLTTNGNAQREATTPVVIAPVPGPQRSTSPAAHPSPMPTSISSTTVATYFKRDNRSNSCRSVQKGRGRKMTRKNIGIVIGDFAGLFPDELTLTLGERIDIISKDTVVSRNIGWWTGRDKKGKIGIFPAACVKIVSSSMDTADLNLQNEYPLEISPVDVVLREVIGVGGFGKVHRAVYKGHEVAVKVAKHTTFDSLKAVQDVISEAEKFAHLAHQNVCALVGVVLVKDVCLIMEYARGGALSEALHKRAISLPIDVIMDWATQIAAGMDYLHNEAEPSLIHRDLKSSNILLSNEIDPSNLYGNVIKITDFGLAREIEHTTQMSGAGTYPWMAPEVIRSSDFSKKSDVWSYAVVLWELLTGERPFGGLNLFVVAYGVGQGTLSLPIPDGCPKPLETLMKDCWQRTHSDRPTFTEILVHLKEAEEESFFSSTSHEVFRSIQSSWKDEIRERFVELKKIEAEIQQREQTLQKRMQLQDRRLQEQQEALEKAQVDFLLLEQKLQELETKERPPRIKKFSFRKLFRHWLSSTGAEGVGASGILPDRVTPKRTISYPSPAEHAASGTSSKRQSLPGRHRPKSTDWRHNESNEQGASSDSSQSRRRSADLPPGVSKEQLLMINSATGQFQRRRGSTPSPTNSATSAHTPSLTLPASQLKPSPPGVQKVKELAMPARGRSSSDPRSPSPQHLPPHVSPPRSPNARQASTGSIAISQSAAVAAVSHNRPSQKPVKLPLGSKTHSTVDSNSPGSPMMTITTAEGHSLQYDSGKDSISCSDASNSSQQLIKLDSPPATEMNKTFELFSEFDPLRLRQSISDPLQQSLSNDSLLCDITYRSKTSGSSSPGILSTSPQPSFQAPPHWSTRPHHTSPKQSLTSDGSIVRARPKGLSIQTPEVPHPISAPSSRPHSPKPSSASRHKLGNSPTGSVHSLVQYPTNYDSDYAVGILGFQSDSDATSTTSSIMDLTDFPDPTPTIFPTTIDHSDLDSIDVNLDQDFFGTSVPLR